MSHHLPISFPMATGRIPAPALRGDGGALPSAPRHVSMLFCQAASDAGTSGPCGHALKPMEVVNIS